jgi:hypothetical protein
MINIPKRNPNIDNYLDMAVPEAIRFEGLDCAIVGTDHNGLLVYDYERMIEIFVVDSGMTIEEAIEWIDYNVIGVDAGQGFTVLYTQELIL